MAITTYSELQTAVADWLHRVDLTDIIPDFIALAEAKIYRTMRLSNMETRTTTDTVAGESYIARPSDSNGIREVKINSDPIRLLKYETPEVVDQKYLGSTNNKPIVYTIVGDEIRLAPVPDSAYEVEIAYYKRPTALSDANTSNWFLANAPDLLLYGALLEASPYLMDDPRVPLWLSAFESVKAQLIEQDQYIKYPEGRLLTTVM